MSQRTYSFCFIISLIAFIIFEYYSMANIAGLGDSSLRSFSKLIIEVIAFLCLLFGRIRHGLFFWILWFCWCFITSALFSHQVGISKYVSLCFPQAAFMVGFYCMYKRVNIIKWLTPATLVLLGIGMYFMFNNNNQFIAVALSVRSADNLIFYLICIVPFVFLLKNFPLKCILLTIITGMSIYSLKRTALIIIGVIILLFVFDLLKGNKKNRFKRIIIASVVIFYGYNYIMENTSGSIERSISRFENISEDKGSGRDRLWEDMFSALSRNDAIDWIFGHGPNSTMAVAHHTSGHNDVLTLLLEQGIVGTTFYLIFIFRLFVLTIRLYTQKSQYKIAASCILVIVSLMGALSNLVPLATYFAFLTFSLGIIKGASYGNTRLRTLESRLS